MKKIEIIDILESVISNPGNAFFYTPAIYKNSYSYFFTSPQKKYSIDSVKIFKKVLSMEQVYGYLNYEAASLFDKEFPAHRQNGYGVFYFSANLQKIKSSNIGFNIVPQNLENYKLSTVKLNTDYNEFKKNINCIKEEINSGNTYQVNYTLKSNFRVFGSVISLFLSLLFNQSAKYIAIINTGEQLVISLSPELFFSLTKNKITVKPMKGTTKRGYNLETDLANEHFLKNSIKEKAENVMIVDLLRNDLGRIAQPGSVKPVSLFDIEKYESVFQMTSTITARLKEIFNLFDVFSVLFPCGSVTGAPKISTMKIIDKLEKEKRGVYTGAVGFSIKDYSIFNVPIRTLVLNNNYAALGIGSGIVWDSKAKNEFEEVKLKSHFLTKANKYFTLFTTMLIENGKPFLFEEHIERLKLSSSHFLFMFNENLLRNQLQKYIEQLSPNKNYKLKITLHKWGRIEFTSREFIQSNKNFKIKLSNKRTDLINNFSYHKTSNRVLYDMELIKAVKNGFDEVIFLNKHNNIVEGSFTNIFIRKGSLWQTPPLEDGALNGIYRKHFISKHNCIQKSFSVQELISADEILLTNALRKEIKAEFTYSTS